jgi:hypothetical protein
MGFYRRYMTCDDIIAITACVFLFLNFLILILNTVNIGKFNSQTEVLGILNNFQEKLRTKCFRTFGVQYSIFSQSLAYDY